MKPSRLTSECIKRCLKRSFALFGACICLAAVSTDVLPASALDTINPSVSYYLDSREFTTASLGISTKRMPGGFSLWGFTDFHGNQSSRSYRLTRSFSEYRLSNPIVGELLNIEGLGFQIEQDVISGKGNDIARFGLTYKHSLKLASEQRGWLQWRVFPVETDSDGGQLSLIYFLPMTPRLSIRGFADYNIDPNGENRWVVEPELNIRLNTRTYALVEYRYNGFEDVAPGMNGSGFAVGLRYRFVD